MDTVVNKAQASTSIALDSFLFFGDLPADEIARQNLLSNHEYVQSVIRMLMTSENSPLIQALGATPEDFAFCQNLSETALKKESSQLFRTPSDIDVAEFIHRESHLFMLTDRVGNNLANKEKKYWESAFKVRLLIEKEHPDWNETAVEKETQKVILNNAVKTIEASYKDDRAETDLFMEPIAHVITNLITGKPIDYKGSIMDMGFGGYHDLLSTQNTGDPNSAIEAWHQKIRKLIKKVQQEKNLGRLSEFFKADSLEDQKRILNHY